MIMKTDILTTIQNAGARVSVADLGARVDCSLEALQCVLFAMFEEGRIGLAREERADAVTPEMEQAAIRHWTLGGRRGARHYVVCV